MFQRTYFCNVRREDDKVTKAFREMYNPYWPDPHFTANWILARCVNRVSTMRNVGYVHEFDEWKIKSALRGTLRTEGQIFGGAYIFSTCGKKMDKVDYLVDIVLEDAWREAPEWGREGGNKSDTMVRALEAIMTVEGISTFMGGQVLADLKNTPNHPLRDAPDWHAFATPGPGSLRGLSWFWGAKVTPKDFGPLLRNCATWLQAEGLGLDLHMQDLQNCLCEFDKYMRVSTGQGKSKRNYRGYQ